APIRTIRGLATQLEDPHGTYFDEAHNEIITANHGNWTQIRPYTPYDPIVTDVGEYKSGAFHPSAITFHAADANGDVPPLRTIEGDLTGLNWPMGIDVDLVHDEIAVANYGDSSIRVYRRGDRGSVQPVRVIRGALTQIVGPVSVAGEVPPLRAIQGTRTRLVRPHTVAVDPVNNEILTADPSSRAIFVFDRMANGNVAPRRVISGERTGLLDIVGLDVDPIRNVIV